MLDGIENAIPVLAFDGEFEYFFLGVIARLGLLDWAQCEGVIMRRRVGQRRYRPPFSMHTTHSNPCKEEIALLTPFNWPGLA
ncbi:hypothetical protein [Candidatus Aalborgicola defluviihabitans]|uniref:hypothetical protein n=1 Tax=Candidatus Aalborgicola defluviihabitans TaxID=3386187 RepID=UPI001EBF40A7|nr:hypothetical protein [Burkholderiales bacterium]